MSFNDNVQIDPGRVSDQRGGRGGLVAGGGVSILGLILALIFGPGVLEGGQDSSQQSTTSQSTTSDSAKCTTGAAANTDDGCRLIATTESLDEYWKAELPANGVVAVTLAGMAPGPKVLEALDLLTHREVLH